MTEKMEANAIINLFGDRLVEPAYPAASVGACAACAMPTSLPYRYPPRMAYPASRYQSNVPKNHDWYRSVALDACVADEIESETVVIPAGEDRTIILEPYRGCFEMRYFGIIVIASTLEGPVEAPVLARVGRFRRGECVLDCRLHPVSALKYNKSDSCPIGCPFHAIIGREDPDNDNLSVVVENISADTEISVQLVSHGRCLPGMGCVDAWERSCEHNGTEPATP